MTPKQTVPHVEKPPWREKLDYVLETMRELSTQTDPQEMVRAYGRRINSLLPADRRMSLSRRNLANPYVKITRYTGWEESINPWLQPERLPVLKGGLLADLIYGNEPVIIDDFSIDKSDPAYAYLEGLGSLMAIPLFDKGEGLNMVVIGRRSADAFDREQLADWVWMSNLFGRATQTLVIADELKRAYHELDKEMEKVGDIQRKLLPEVLPKIPTLDLAAYYKTSQRAGGDHYEFFELPEGRWGILISDVSGHGTPAAVVAAITHGLGMAYAGPDSPPSLPLKFLNEHLTDRYTARIGGFVTAFFAIYDPKTRRLDYSSAGHNPPRLKRCLDGSIVSLDRAQSLPMGIMREAEYINAHHDCLPGDQIVFYTDGITEAMNPQGKMFGVERLDQVLENCALTADGLINSVIEAVEGFSEGHAADDDRTMIVAKVS